MTNKLHPKCHYGEADPYVDFRGNVLPCCWVTAEFDFFTKHVPEAATKFNLSNHSLRNILSSKEWIEMTDSFHEPENGFKQCSNSCRFKNDVNGRSTSTTLRKNNGSYVTNAIHVEPTSRCTLACSKCSRTMYKGTYGIDDLPIEHFVNICAQETHPKILLCGSLGDPIYHRNYHELLHIGLEMGKEIHTVTCGSNRSRKWWEKTAEIVSVNPKKATFTFSVDGLGDTNHLYRKNADWKSIITGLEVMRDTEAKLIWKMIVFKHNQHQIDEVEKLAKSYRMVYNQSHSSRFEGKSDPLRPDEKYVNNA